MNLKKQVWRVWNFGNAEDAFADKPDAPTARASYDHLQTPWRPLPGFGSVFLHAESGVAIRLRGAQREPRLCRDAARLAAPHALFGTVFAPDEARVHRGASQCQVTGDGLLEQFKLKYGRWRRGALTPHDTHPRGAPHLQQTAIPKPRQFY
jgi:hypothetical protein